MLNFQLFYQLTEEESSEAEYEEHVEDPEYDFKDENEKKKRYYTNQED